MRVHIKLHLNDVLKHGTSALVPHIHRSMINYLKWRYLFSMPLFFVFILFSALYSHIINAIQTENVEYVHKLSKNIETKKKAVVGLFLSLSLCLDRHIKWMKTVQRILLFQMDLSVCRWSFSFISVLWQSFIFSLLRWFSIMFHTLNETHDRIRICHSNEAHAQINTHNREREEKIEGEWEKDTQRVLRIICLHTR